MSNRVRFIPYGPSDGLKALTERLGAKRLKLRGSKFRPRFGDIVINWGNSGDYTGLATLNKPASVFIASNKLATFNKLSECGLFYFVPVYCTTLDGAKSLVRSGKVYCRTLLRGSQGRGIVVASTEQELVDAPLYTLGVENCVEVRLHIFCGKVIDYAQKKKMNSDRRTEEGIELDENVRSHGRGWTFCRVGVVIPNRVKEVAIRAISALGLDFGAVDMLYSDNETIVLEINTAPGLEGTTLDSYTNAIQNYIEER